MYKFILAMTLYLISFRIFPEDLWQLAVKGYTDNYISGSLVQEEKVFREDGTLEESSRFVLFITRDGNIRLKEAIVSNKVVKGKELEILEYEANQNREEVFDPFDPELQNFISYKQIIKGEVVNRFHFTYENEGTNITGECYITSKGIPEKTTYRLNSLPLKAQDYTLLELEVVNYYKEGNDLKWKLYNVVEKSVIEISYLFSKVPLFIETSYDFN